MIYVPRNKQRRNDNLKAGNIHKKMGLKNFNSLHIQEDVIKGDPDGHWVERERERKKGRLNGWLFVFSPQVFLFVQEMVPKKNKFLFIVH